MPLRKCLSLLLVVLIFNKSFCQNQYQITTKGYHSTNSYTTFWEQTNQLGMVPETTLSGLAYFYLDSDFTADSAKTNKAIQWGYGIKGAIASTKEATKYILPIAYLKAKVGNVEFRAGRYQQITGIHGNQLLSLGSLTSSSNAIPIPGFSVGIATFKPLAITNDLVSIKGFYSENYVGDNFIRYHSLGKINNAFLHRKMVALKLGKDADPLTIIFSGNHQVMWGGHLDQQSPEMLTASLGTYKSAILGKSASNLLIGDHIGSLDIGMELKTYGWSYFPYRQHIFEGNGHNRGMVWLDGLTGIEMKRLNKLPTTSFHINSALLEVLTSTHQVDYNDGYNPSDASTRVSYYQHTFYKSGWAYQGRAIGNAMLASPLLLQEKWTTTDQDYLTRNNRVIAIHTGIQGKIHQFPWVVKATYSLNSGTYASPFPQRLRQFSFLVKSEMPIKVLGTTQLITTISGDTGELYKRNACISLGLQKSGWF